MLQIFSVNIVTLKSRTVFNDHGHTASAAFLHGACSEGGGKKNINEATKQNLD